MRILIGIVLLGFWVVGSHDQAHGATRPFSAPGRERPSFLFLFSDDQTFRALGLLGEFEVKTPNLDRLAKRGLLFL